MVALKLLLMMPILKSVTALASEVCMKVVSQGGSRIKTYLIFAGSAIFSFCDVFKLKNCMLTAFMLKLSRRD
jgi:hypothetical protein